MKLKKVAKMAFVVVLSMVAMSKTTKVMADSGFSVTSSIPVNFGQEYSKSWVKQTDELDCFNKFDIDHDGYVTIRATKAIDSFGQSGEMKCILYNEEGKEIWSQKTSSSGTILDTVECKAGLTRGTYYLNIRPEYRVITGVLTANYQIDFTQADNYEKEMNDDTAHATPLEFNTTVNGFLQSREKDYYSFQTTTRSNVKLTIGNYTVIDDDNSAFHYVFADGNEGYLFDRDFISNPDGSAYANLDVPAGTNFIYIHSYGSNMHEYDIKVEKGLTEGDVFSVDGIQYEITYLADRNSTCKVVGAEIPTVVIEKEVVSQGITFKVNEIASKAFENNKKLTKVVIKARDIEEIGESAFSGCTKLKEADLSECRDLEEIPSGLFKDCTSLQKVKFYKYNIETIGKNAFSGCKKLNISLSDLSNVEEIEAGAFKNCTSLKKIEAPRSLETIGKEAFAGCSKVTEIDLTTCYSTLESVGKNAFKGINKNAVIKIYYKSQTSLVSKKGQSSSVKIKYKFDR